MKVFEGRDKILLDGNDSSSRGKGLEDYDDEEEVFALKGMDDSDSDAGDYDDDNGGSDDEEESEGDDDDEMEDGDSPPPSTTKTAKKAAPKPKAKSSKQDGDEEAASDDDDLEERWGKNKSAYYSSNAQELDSDDEEARQLEELEALRLQAKAREGITDDDFGLNDLNAPTVQSSTNV